ncbi:MAG TPA: TetR/AcrR family transcriptional regulator [Candidatus Ventricola gallistercoris]|nr:TetR/AcrR family transcriptional regulator [Candidatus Ventricola gallistercoris]
MPEKTQSAIIRATILLFNQYGPMVPMSLISKEAGVAAGTPFRYFRTKEELLAAAYHQAHNNTLQCVPQESIEGMSAQQAVKSIVHTIMKWSALCPHDLEYMRKYEDMVCYDCFSQRFSDTLYVGIIRDMNLWPLLSSAVRPDLPEPLLNRLISFNCSIYSRYITHRGLTPDDPEFAVLADATADSIWNSIRAD